MTVLDSLVQRFLGARSQLPHASTSLSPRQEREGQVFLLGAGFSYAVSDSMPTMRTLLDELKRTSDEEQWTAAISTGLPSAHDLESWLDSLAIPQPYRTDVENAEAAGLFRRVTAWLGDYLSDIQSRSFENGYPPWLITLLAHWQITQCTVITMNYDTIIERCVDTHHEEIGLSNAGALPASNIRATPMTPASAFRGVGRLDGGAPAQSFRLAKLHGSLDWMYPGGSGRGLPIYTLDTDRDTESQNTLPHLVPYIVPPSFAKVQLFEHEILRQNWHVARQGLQDSSELVVMGYSLPPADTAVVQMLRVFGPRKVTVLDTNPGIAPRYQETLPGEIESITTSDPIGDWIQAKIDIERPEPPHD